MRSLVRFARRLRDRIGSSAPLCPSVQIAVAVVFVLLVWSPFLAGNAVDNAFSDWAYRTDYAGYALNAIRHDHVFPFWVTDARFEQFRAKGIHDFFANPETDVLSLVTPFAAWWGLFTAVKVSLAVYLALGVWGCRRLLALVSRDVSLSALVLASLLALANGALVGHVLSGHTQFSPVALFPLTLALFVEAFDLAAPLARRSFLAAASGALLAVSYYAGAAHLLFYCLAAVGLVALFTVVVSPRRARAVVPALAITFASFLVLSAFKLLPGMFDFGDYSASYHDVFASVKAFLVELVIPWYPEGHGYHHETNTYVGWGGAVVLGLGLLSVRDRRTLPLALACAALAMLMFYRDPRLFALPLLRSQGALRRARILVIELLAVLAAGEIQRFTMRLSPRARRWFGAASLVLSVALAVDLSRTNVLRHMTLRHDGVPAMNGPFDAAPELVGAHGTVAHVVTRSMTANSFTYEVSTTTSDWSLVTAPSIPAAPRRPHLRLEGDGALVSQDGVLGVRFRGPHAQFKLRYDDPFATAGLVVSCLGLAGLLALGGLAHRQAFRRLLRRASTEPLPAS